MRLSYIKNRTVILGFLFVLLFTLCGCGEETPETPPAETIRVKYIPVTDEETTTGHHYFGFAPHHPDERFGVFMNVDTANVTEQTFKEDADGSFIVDYSDVGTREAEMGYPARTIYQKANIYADSFHGVDFTGFCFSYNDLSSLALYYAVWSVEYTGTDWELYQPIFHVYKVSCSYIERNADETVTFYRCNFSYRLHYDEDWLSEYAVNKADIPIYN